MEDKNAYESIILPPSRLLICEFRGRYSFKEERTVTSLKLKTLAKFALTIVIVHIFIIMI